LHTGRVEGSALSACDCGGAADDEVLVTVSAAAERKVGRRDAVMKPGANDLAHTGISFVAFHPTNAGTYYAAAATGGIFTGTGDAPTGDSFGAGITRRQYLNVLAAAMRAARSSNGTNHVWLSTNAMAQNLS
jgi:hypothetical protein